MSIFLIFYALGNLQNVSWGTRETEAELVAKAKNEEMAEIKIKAETSNPRKLSTIDRVHNFFATSEKSKKGEMESEYNFSCGNIFRCLCFPKEKSLNKDDLLEPLIKRFDEIVQMHSLELANMKTCEEAEAPDQNGEIKEDKKKPEAKDNVSSSNGEYDIFSFVS
ncbi:CHS1 [Acanthosepion pharaonis]|uniref:CHS1 n=1 Tax=Acanthosepion pharaonis TaxID=158019 RepID=A0A812EZW5_ACAPH|nr:CHS1 [Sepia pharaonis]